VKSLGIRVTDTVYAAIKAAAERDKRRWRTGSPYDQMRSSHDRPKGSRPTAIAASDTRPKRSRHF